MNTVIRQVRPDHARKCAAALGRPLEEIWPDDDIQVMHYDLFPHEIIHIENAGGQIDRTEMYQVFNMGIGMTVVVSASDRAKALKLTKGRVIGRIEKGGGIVRLAF